MLREFFGKKRHYATIGLTREATAEPPKDNIPKGIVDKCNRCGEILIARELQKHAHTCPHCNYHFLLGANDRIALTMDEDSFTEIAERVQSADPLRYPDYPAKVEKAQSATQMLEGTVVGQGTILGHPVVMGVMDFNFMAGSLGSAAGEKITRAIEFALQARLPFVMFCAGGGMRMHEGILSLMQMAKISGALSRLHEAGILYVSVITDPTTGGTSASFASLGDIIIAEPGALYGFAGPRVIEQTIRQKLPEGFQTAEFNKDHGLIDGVVHRKDLRQKLATILQIHTARGWSNGH